MSIIRNKTKDKYTTLDNSIFKSKLSLKARGLIATLLSLPNNWKFSENGIESILNDGRDSIRSGVKELEAFGYLQRNRLQGKDGRFNGYEWIVRERPYVIKPLSDCPILENHTQSNTNIVNTNNIVNTINSIKESDDKSVDGNELIDVYGQPLSSATQVVELPSKMVALSQEEIDHNKEVKRLDKEAKQRRGMLIGRMLADLKAFGSLSSLDGTIAMNNVQAGNLIRLKIIPEFKKAFPDREPTEDDILVGWNFLLDKLRRQEYHKNKATNMAYVYSNFNKILKG